MPNTNGRQGGDQSNERDSNREELALAGARMKRAENLAAARQLAGKLGPNAPWIDIVEGNFRPDPSVSARWMARVLSPLSSGEQPEYTAVARGVLVAHGAYPAYVAGGIPTYQAVVLLEDGRLLALRGAHVAESRPDRWVVAPSDPGDPPEVKPCRVMDDNPAEDGLAWNLNQADGPRLDLAGELPSSTSPDYWQRYMAHDAESAIAAGLQSVVQLA